MQGLQIKTTQHVAIVYSPAGLGERIIAYILDWFVLGAYFFLLIYLGTHIQIDLPNWLDALIFFVPILLYDLVLEITLQGQSFGKKIMGLRVISMDGASPTGAQLVLRWCFRLIDIFLFIPGAVATLSIVLSGKGQRVGDRVAGTAVIKLSGNVAARLNLLDPIEQDYEPSFPEVTFLQQKDIDIVQEVVDVLEMQQKKQFLKEKIKSQAEEVPLSPAQETLLVQTCQKLCDILDIPRQNPSLTFLKTLLKDYYYAAK
jgi:uncharacterized RDD family membrane protein YckC